MARTSQIHRTERRSGIADGSFVLICDVGEILFDPCSGGCFWCRYGVTTFAFGSSLADHNPELKSVNST